MRTYWLLLLLTISVPSKGQVEFGFSMPKKETRIEVPFTEINNLIVIPIVLNNFLKLNFILDTGVETPILTEMVYSNLLRLEYIREITLNAPGIQDSIQALVAQKVNIRLPGNIQGKNLSLLVLRNDYLRLSEKMGMDVHGIIGYDLFKQFVIEIDYDEHILIFHKPDKFKPRKKDLVIHLDISQSKPFMQSIVSNDKASDSVKLMIDTGASHAVLLDGLYSDLPMPQKTLETKLGTGLGGEIPGQIGRINALKIGHLEFKEIIVSIPNEDAYSQLIKRGSRQGTLGGDVLSRMHPTFDYPHQALYLRKGQDYKARFEVDMSGLTLKSSGPFLDEIVIDDVRENSPAHKAGVQEGDQIISINGKTPTIYKLSDFNYLLRKKANHKIKIRVRRDDEKYCYRFRLQRVI